MDESRPLFVQIAEAVENDIVGGVLPEGAQIPSINEFAAFHRINPATALKGVTLLVDDGVVEKRRGIGMFVVRGARARLLRRRRDRFAEQFVAPLLAEADKLGIPPQDLVSMIDDMVASTRTQTRPATHSTEALA
ncbi:MAG: GntR family transcriptional regulator [Dermatophilaceae bacterium]